MVANSQAVILIQQQPCRRAKDPSEPDGQKKNNRKTRVINAVQFRGFLLAVILFSAVSPAFSAVEDVDKDPLYHSVTVQIDARNHTLQINPMFFGVCPMAYFDNDQALADGVIEKHLNELPCNFLRFPGGTDSDGYLWDENRLQDNTRWPFEEGDHTTDTDEFIALCRRIGAEPIMCVNTELAIFEGDERAVKLAADWVRYCNKQKKYNVKYWEIGNEPYYHVRFYAHEYAKLLIKMSRAMKAVDPTIKIAAVGEWNVDYPGLKAMIPKESVPKAQKMEYQFEQGDWDVWNEVIAMATVKDAKPWWPVVLEKAGEDIDMVSIHWYFNLDDHLKRMTHHLERLQKLCREKVPGRELPVIMTEWSVYEHIEVFGMERATAVGEAAGKMLAGGVRMANYWPLRCGGIHERKGLLNSETNTPSANYKVLQLFSKYVGETIVPSTSSDEKLYPFATTKKTGEISVFLVNRRKQDVRVSLKVKGFEEGKALQRLLRPKDKPSSNTTVWEEQSVFIKNHTIAVSLPPFSVLQMTLSE